MDSETRLSGITGVAESTGNSTRSNLCGGTRKMVIYSQAGWSPDETQVEDRRGTDVQIVRRICV